MIEFLAQMPTDTMIFITAAVLSLAATLIGLRWADLKPCNSKRADRSRLGVYFAATSPLVLSDWYFCLRLSKSIC